MHFFRFWAHCIRWYVSHWPRITIIVNAEQWANFEPKKLLKNYHSGPLSTNCYLNNFDNISNSNTALQLLEKWQNYFFTKCDLVFRASCFYFNAKINFLFWKTFSKCRVELGSEEIFFSKNTYTHTYPLVIALFFYV